MRNSLGSPSTAPTFCAPLLSVVVTAVGETPPTTNRNDEQVRACADTFQLLEVEKQCACACAFECACACACVKSSALCIVVAWIHCRAAWDLLKHRPACCNAMLHCMG
eukprot:m.76548 g.76548  ORF g.76548 m.76548 type:complete len:108 (-) comp12488_c0_seq1:239-562(-)